MQKTTSTKLMARHHTGKILHHRHTSYGALALVLLLATMPLFYASQSVTYAIATEGSGSYTTNAVVTGPAPKAAPTLSSVVNGTIYRTSAPILIKGSCESNTLVKVFKNNVLAGASLCQNGSFQMQIDLFVGSNSLVARAYNTNDVASPDSSVVSVQFLPPNTPLNSSSQLNVIGAPASQFYLTSELYYRGANVGDTISWPIIIGGGQPPYALSVSWGDGKTELISRGDAKRFDISHVYHEAAGSKGGFTIIIKGTDQTGTQTYLQLVAIVKGAASNPGVVSSITGGYDHSGIIRAGWQLLAGAAIFAFSFWLGEKRELRQLNQHKVRRTA
jgi:hypothetical protein